MKKIVALLLALTMLLALTACGAKPEEKDLTGVADGVLTVGMECAYAPYNWTQMDDSNGAVPIANNPVYLPAPGTRSRSDAGTAAEKGDCHCL